MARRDDENPRTPTPPNELRDDHADLERLAQPDGVGKQHPRPQPRRIQGLAHRPELVAQRIREHLLGDVQRRRMHGHRRLTQRGFQPQLRMTQPLRPVELGHDLRRIGHHDLIERSEKRRRGIANEIGHATNRQPETVSRLRNVRHQPGFISDDNRHTRGKLVESVRGGVRAHADRDYSGPKGQGPRLAGEPAGRGRSRGGRGKREGLGVNRASPPRPALTPRAP